MTMHCTSAGRGGSRPTSHRSIRRSSGTRRSATRLRTCPALATRPLSSARPGRAGSCPGRISCRWRSRWRPCRTACPWPSRRQRLLGRPASEYGTLCQGAGGHAGSHRCRRAFMLTCMKRLAVSSRGVFLPVSRFRVFACSGRQWALVSRGSVSRVFALVKGEGYSPAHEGIRGVGAPSIQRPCRSGHVNIRAHPPVEPARDHEAQLPHHHRVQSGPRVPHACSAATESGRAAGRRGAYTVPSRRSA